MSQQEGERSKNAPREDVGPTVAPATAGCEVIPIALYYVGALLCALWSWQAFFGRARTPAAFAGLVVWMAAIVGIFYLAGVFLKPQLIRAVESFVHWLMSLGRGSRMARGQWLVECDHEAVRCSWLGDEVETLRWADLEAVWVITTDRGPWEDDVFFVLKGTERECTVSNEALGMPGLIERLTQLPGFDEEAYFEAMCCTDRERFLIWRRHDATSGAGDQTRPTHGTT